MSSRDRTPAAEQGSPADGSTTRPSNATNDANSASGAAEQPRRRSRRRRRHRRRGAPHGSSATADDSTSATAGSGTADPAAPPPSGDAAAGTGNTTGGSADAAGKAGGAATRPGGDATGGTGDTTRRSGDATGGAGGATAGSPSTGRPGGGRRKRRRRHRGGSSGQAHRRADGASRTEPGRAAEAPTRTGGGATTGSTTPRSAAKRRRRRRTETPPPGQIRGRRRTRSGRIEEVSSGGLVVDVRGDEVFGVLIGKHDRRGRLIWSLPKGHVELGETLEQTAVREIEEETGVSSEVRAPLGEVDYWFMLHGEKIHKTVHHFLLRYLAGELSDRDREVVEVAWVPLDELGQRLAHPDERRLIAPVPGMLSECGA